jgi:hypothetical protein
MSGNVEVLAFFADCLVIDFGDDEIFLCADESDEPFVVGRGVFRRLIKFRTRFR